MSTVKLNGTTVYVQAVESVEDGVSLEYDRLWNRATQEVMSRALSVRNSSSLAKINEEIDKVVFPKVADHPAVIVKLTSGREFRIVGRTRQEVEFDIYWAKKRDK